VHALTEHQLVAGGAAHGAAGGGGGQPECPSAGAEARQAGSRAAGA